MVAALIVEQLRDPRSRFSIGSFGAVAEFARSADEAVAIDGLSAATSRGAIRFGDLTGVRAIAFETGFAEGWSQAIALCVPAAACVRPAAGEPGGCDLGLDLPHIAAYRRGDRVVFDCGFARIEVLIDGPGGPRVAIAPEAARRGRSHAATDPIPHGWIPCVRITPPHPMTQEGFDAGHHDDFQHVLTRFGDPAHLAMKERIFAALRTDSPLPPAATRAERNSLRVALRQWEAQTGASDLRTSRWNTSRQCAFTRTNSGSESVASERGRGAAKVT